MRLLRRSAGAGPAWVRDAADVAAADPHGHLGLQPDTWRGLGAHQAHAQAISRRTLVAHHPTVHAMLGDDAMGLLAWMLWLHAPLREGDLGAWGDDLSALIASHPEVAPQLTAWPWLADTARLDAAVHRCSRLAHHPMDAHALQALGQGDPGALALLLQPHVQVCRSPWPLAELWHAHQRAAADPAAAQRLMGSLAHGAHANGVPANGDGGAVVWWCTVAHAAQVAPLSQADAAWMADLRDQQASLGTLLSRHPPTSGFDFGGWWLRALRHGWLRGTAPWPANGPQGQ